MYYMSWTKAIIHRDIKPANILLSNGISKFGDFGFSVSKHIKSAKQNQLELYNVGTPLYMAPETILHNMYSHKSDIWSLGVVLFEMLYGIHIYLWIIRCCSLLFKFWTRVSFKIERTW